MAAPATLLSGLIIAEDTTAPPLRLFNSKTKKKELFVPRVKGKVGMYICGVMPYDSSHVGHTRAYVAFDVLYRYLNFLGYEVNYVRNFTDVDDKIIERAKQNGEDISSLCTRFINEFHTHMTELQCMPPTVEPRVKKHIEDIVDLITEIIKNDKGYAVDGSVYFSINRFSEYLSLSGRKQDDNLAGSRVDVDPKKQNDADFALWKAAKEGEPSWESPWGDGRPGWHIECSAMSARYLGHVFDIHGGGKDLIFPHHENELAQSRAAYPESEVNCWMHNGFINNCGEKNIMTQYHPMALRFFLVRAHYKSDMNYSDEALEIASDRVYYIYKTLHDCDEMTSLYHEENISVPVPAEEQKLVDGHHKAFLESMSDDLRTTNQKPQRQPEDHIQALAALSAEIKSKLSILGLMPQSPLAELEHLKEKALMWAGLTDESLREQIERRVAARNNKQFDVSDHIRKDLASKGIALMDEPTGTVWRPCERE
ncbi:hypothetical protein VPH35_004889 [Triticum aestivum]